MKRPNINDYPITDSRTFKNLNGSVNWQKYAKALNAYIEFLSPTPPPSGESITTRLRRLGFNPPPPSPIGHGNNVMIKLHKMDLHGLLDQLGIGEKKIIAHLITPIRTEENYRSGEVVGFKPGSEYKKKSEGRTIPHIFDSPNQRWRNKPKVMVAYNSLRFDKSQHFDWVEIDNCNFEIV